MSTFTIPRLYSDAKGESRFDSIELPMELHIHAPPAEPFLVSDFNVAMGYIFFRIPVGWVGLQHTTPNYRLVICLKGALKFIGSAGDSLTLRPGERMMDTNTVGKGHATEVVSDEPVEGIIIRVD
jgi:hypothetical protein